MTRVEHFPVTPVTPPMQPRCFIPDWDTLVRHKASFDFVQPFGRIRQSRRILGIGSLEESALVYRPAFGVVILDREESVVKWF